MKKRSNLSKVIKDAAARFDSRSIHRASIEVRAELKGNPVLTAKSNCEQKINELIDLASKLRRGCDCEYDYRCSNCSMILSVSNLADELKAGK